jgi:hypothetical protein
VLAEGQGEMKKKKFIKMPVVINEERWSGQRWIEVNLSEVTWSNEVTLVDWCLSLVLLRLGLIGSLVIMGNRKLEIKMDQSIEETDKQKVRVQSERIQIAVNPTELDSWLDFFLKYYRDGVAEVNHIDVEATNASDEREQLDVVFKVRDAAEPISAAEGRRMLGLD